MRDLIQLVGMTLLVILAVSPRAQGQGAAQYGEDIYWNATPNDINNLLKSLAQEADAHYQMEIKELREISTDPEQNPVLYRTGHYLFEYSAAERARLRKYLLAGGMIIYNTGLGSAPFYRSVVAELKQIFPEQPLQRLTSDHPIFHSYYDIDRVDYTPAVRQAGLRPPRRPGDLSDTTRQTLPATNPGLKQSRSIVAWWPWSHAGAWPWAGRAMSKTSTAPTAPNPRFGSGSIS